MILCPAHGFAFVHVPKCAGSSVRRQIEDADPGNVVYGRPGEHPTLGLIDYGHIPLATLREHFADAYAFLLEHDAYAVARDPLARFGSAVRQTLWSYEHKPMTLYAPGELRDKTLRLMDEVARDIDALPYRLTFFQRQDDFVHDGGRRIVEHVYAIDHVDRLLDDLGRRMGRTLDPELRANQNVSLRVKALGGLAYRVNDLLFRHAPPRLHAAVKGAALRVLARKEDAATESGMLDWPEVRAFVAEHYAADFALYRDALAARAAPAA